MSKSEKLRLIDYLAHIVEATQRISQYSAGMTEQTFINTILVQDAVIRNLENIGEACRNIERRYPEFIEKYSNLPISAAYGMRNILAHEYFAVDLELVWKTIEEKIPELEQDIKQILKELNI